MNLSTVDKTQLQAIYCAVPRNVIDNKEFASSTFSDNLENTITALGVLRRHVCADRNTTALTLAVAGAKELLKDLDYNPQDIGAIVFVTLTPDNLMPNNASAAHALIGCADNCAAFDINHACSGYMYGLWVSSLLCANLQKDVLLLDADTNSYYASPKDKATGLLFGDAGSASLIRYKADAQPGYFSFFTNGEQRDALTLPKFGFKYPMSEESLKYREHPDGSIRRDIDMYMNGEEVFNYVVSNVPKHVKQFLDEIEMLPEEFDGLLMHQANAFMLRQLAKRIGFNKDKILFSIQEYGNTSSVSIPLTIAHNKSMFPSKKMFLMIGMGAGLSTGISMVDLSGLTNLKIIEGDF